MVADCTPICALLVRMIDTELASWSALNVRNAAYPMTDFPSWRLAEVRNRARCKAADGSSWPRAKTGRVRFSL